MSLTQQKSLEPRVCLSKRERSSMKLFLWSKSGTKSTHQLTRYLTQSFHTPMTWEMLTDMTLPTLWEIKGLVGHATLFHSHKWLNLALNRNMDKKSLYFPHSSWWPATTWPKDVTEVGPSSTATSLKMDTLSKRSVLHTKPRQKESTADSTLSANHRQKSKRATSSEVLMASLPKREWWRISSETE